MTQFLVSRDERTGRPGRPVRSVRSVHPHSSSVNKMCGNREICGLNPTKFY